MTIAIALNLVYDHYAQAETHCWEKTREWRIQRIFG